MPYYIYHLDRSDKSGPDEISEMIVVAETARLARLIASTAAGSEGPAAWRQRGAEEARTDQIGIAKEGQRRSVIMTSAAGQRLM